jgi:hypothetical protein
MHKIAEIVRSWLFRVMVGSIIVLLVSIMSILINTLFLRVPWLPMLQNNIEDGDKQLEVIVLDIPWPPVQVPMHVCLWHWCVTIKVGCKAVKQDG